MAGLKWQELYVFLQRTRRFQSLEGLRRCYSVQTIPNLDITKSSYYHYIGRKPLVYRNVGQELERAAAEYGSTEAIVSYAENKRISYQALIKEADRLGAALIKHGLQRGDHVGIWGPNSLPWYLTMMGAVRAGLVSVGLNPAFQAREIEYCLKKVNVKAVVTPLEYKTQNYYEILCSICPELANSEPGKLRSNNLPHLKSVIIHTELSSQPRGALSLDQLLDLPSFDDVANISNLQSSIVPDTPCNVQFTSGTTGHPKAAVLSHYNFVNNAIHIAQRNEYAGQRICVQVPLFHAYGVVISIMASLAAGATLVLPAQGFDPEASLRAIIAEKCSVILGTPTMYVDLIRRQQELQLPLTTARMAITGGAPCSPKLFLDIKKVLGLEHIRTVFGLTEATAVIFQSRSGDSMDQILNTVGHIQDHIEAKVINAEGHIVPCGQPGELCIRGYCTMLGYHGDPEKTRETIGDDKWLHTGDQFVLQEDGYGRIVGRLKEMINRGGENIFPKEIEDFLNTHPNILETHVIGVPDERMGEEVCAYVRLSDGIANLTRDEVKTFCRGQLAHFKVPRYVIPIENFPKTVSGKIQKFKLLQLYQKQKENCD